MKAVKIIAKKIASIFEIEDYKFEASNKTSGQNGVDKLIKMYSILR